MQVKISVVIPTYKRPALLVNCLDALLKQSLSKEEFEVIVVSDGYDPESERVVKKFQLQYHLFKYYHLDEKKGPAAARNLGWQNAKGNLVAFTDDDCIPHQEWLEGFLKLHMNEEKVAYGGRIFVPLSMQPTDYEKNTAGLEKADFVTANCCCTKLALQATGGFDEQFSMAWREDTDLEFKLIQQNIPVYYRVDATVIHPPRTAVWGVSIKEQKKNMFNALLYKKHPELYRKKVQKHPRWDYYMIILFTIMFMAGVANESIIQTFISALGWGLLIGRFISERLSGTTKEFNHVMEMIFTSVAIPYASVYWRIYGAIKFRVLFI